jgi:heptosyltransferase-2
MKILVRLPNWLGDMVMSLGFLNQLPGFYPGAEVSFIVKKGLHTILPFFPSHNHAFIFNKKEQDGLKGLYQFGKSIRETEKFDLFFVLPDSFSSAWMAFNSGADKTIGYKNDFRQSLLTESYPKPKNLHRAEEYMRLLELFTGKTAQPLNVRLSYTKPKENYLVVNINSEAVSRRLPEEKAVSLISEIRSTFPHRILLSGGPWEYDFVEGVINKIGNRSGIENVCKTTLPELTEILAAARLVMSTDSGPAHLANALGTPTVSLFGAGRESNTAPYHGDWGRTIRLGELSCEPCEKNVCVRYGIPQCLVRLDNKKIIQTAQSFIGNGNQF